MADDGEENRVVDFARGQTSEGVPAGFLVHPSPGGPAVILVVSGGPTITVELDMDNGYHLWRQLDTAMRDLVS
jgi:hypothetical protein